MSRTKLARIAQKGRKILSAAARVARVRSRIDPVTRALARAPIDEEETTPEDLAAIEEAREEQGPGLSLAEVRRRLRERHNERENV